MADNVTFGAGNNATPPNATVAATDELSDGSHAGLAKLLISADGDRTFIPATAADGLLVNLGANNDVTVSGTVSVTEPVSVDDNGGSLTVDAPVGTPVNVQVGDGALTATVRNTGASDSLNVSVVDAAGNQITSFGGSGGTSEADDADFTPGTTLGTPAMGVFESAPTNVTDGDLGIVGITQDRQLKVLEENSAGIEALLTTIDGDTGTLAGTVVGSEVQVDVVAALPAGNNNIGDVDIASLPNEGQQTMANSISVAVASDQSAIPISDGGNVITVDGTVTANQGAAGTAWEVVGDVAADVAVPANPVAIGGRASDALPSEVSGDGDSVYLWLLRNGALMAANLPHLGLLGDPYTLTSETAQYTTTQTSTALVSPGGGQRVAVTFIQIQAGGTTSGTLQVYFGDGAYSRGTSLAIFDGEFAPSATLKPGFALAPPKPWIGGADEELRVTDSAAINPLTITVWYYLI